MASTISAATLTVSVTESITLNGSNMGATNTKTISGVNEISQRIISLDAANIRVIYEFGATVGAGTFIQGDVKYVRITNKDDTNHLTLTFKNESNDEFAVLLDKGQTFIYNGDLAGGVVNTFQAKDAGGLADVTAITDLVNFTAIANTAACDMEIFVAST